MTLLKNNTESIFYWINHHLNTVNINLIFFRKEYFDNDKLDYSKLLNIPNVIFIESAVITNSYNSYENQQYRQIDFVNRCINKYCPMYDIDYLLHIDDDELLVLHKKWDNIHHYLEKLQWDRHHKWKTHLRIQNFEAILNSSRNEEILFKKTRVFKNCVLEDCRGYSNGKSIANLHFCQECNGCHTFKGESVISKIEDILILHFDSIFFNDWEKKFNRLKNISYKCFNNIPFSFYKQSIEICRQNSLNKKKKIWFDNISQCKYPIDVTEKYNINF